MRFSPTSYMLSILAVVLLLLSSTQSALDNDNNTTPLPLPNGVILLTPAKDVSKYVTASNLNKKLELSNSNIQVLDVDYLLVTDTNVTLQFACRLYGPLMSDYVAPILEAAFKELVPLGPGATFNVYLSSGPGIKRDASVVVISLLPGIYGDLGHYYAAPISPRSVLSYVTPIAINNLIPPHFGQTRVSTITPVLILDNFAPLFVDIQVDHSASVKEVGIFLQQTLSSLAPGLWQYEWVVQLPTDLISDQRQLQLLRFAVLYRPLGVTTPTPTPTTTNTTSPIPTNNISALVTHDSLETLTSILTLGKATINDMVSVSTSSTDSNIVVLFSVTTPNTLSVDTLSEALSTSLNNIAPALARATWKVIYMGYDVSHKRELSTAYYYYYYCIYHVPSSVQPSLVQPSQVSQYVTKASMNHLLQNLTVNGWVEVDEEVLFSTTSTSARAEVIVYIYFEMTLEYVVKVLVQTLHELVPTAPTSSWSVESYSLIDKRNLKYTSLLPHYYEFLVTYKISY